MFNRHDNSWYEINKIHNPDKVVKIVCIVVGTLLACIILYEIVSGGCVLSGC